MRQGQVNLKKGPRNNGTEKRTDRRSVTQRLEKEVARREQPLAYSSVLEKSLQPGGVGHEGPLASVQPMDDLDVGNNVPFTSIRRKLYRGCLHETIDEGHKRTVNLG